MRWRRPCKDQLSQLTLSSLGTEWVLEEGFVSLCLVPEGRSRGGTEGVKEQKGLSLKQSQRRAVWPVSGGEGAPCIGGLEKAGGPLVRNGPGLLLT